MTWLLLISLRCDAGSSSQSVLFMTLLGHMMLRQPRDGVGRLDLHMYDLCQPCRSYLSRLHACMHALHISHWLSWLGFLAEWRGCDNCEVAECEWNLGWAERLTAC